MVEELGIRMEALKEKVTIKIANDQKSRSDVNYRRDWIGEFRPGQVDSTIVAKTSHSVCG